MGQQLEDTFLFDDDLYLRPETNTGALSTGDIIQLGSAMDAATTKRIAQGTIDSINADTYPYLSLSPTLTSVDGYPTPFRYGTGISYIPALETYRRDDSLSVQNIQPVWSYPML